MEEDRKSDINLYIYGQMIFEEDSKNTQWGKDIIPFSK